MAKQDERKCLGCEENCSDLEVEEAWEEWDEKRRLLEQRELDLRDLEGEVALLRDEVELLEQCFGKEK